MAATSPESYIQISYPDLYDDWQADRGRAILWDAYNVEEELRIELHREGEGKIKSIAIIDAAEGEYTWRPQSSNIEGDAE